VRTGRKYASSEWDGAASAPENTGEMRFVFANPPAEEPLLPGDCLYILAPHAWGILVKNAAEAPCHYKRRGIV
jgi:hypothetical protein